MNPTRKDAMTAAMITAILAKQYGFNGRTVLMNLDGFTEQQALSRPPGGGSCANWVLGHILSSRNGVHRLLDLEPALAAADAARYVRGSAVVTAADPGLPLADLSEAFQASQERVVAAIPALGIQQLDRQVAMPAPLGDGPVGVHLGFLSFHESYHAGQLGILRRLAGLPGAIG